MGLPNPGAIAVSHSLASGSWTCPRFVSMADEELSEVIQNHELLEPLVDGVELNASCPNVSWGRNRDNERHVATLVHEIARRKQKPLFVKLPPYRTEAGRKVVLALARLAVESGADGLTCANSLPVPEPRLAMGGGGLTGRPLLEWTLRIVAEVRGATDGLVPINASGGVFTPEDVLSCLSAGATTVQVYTALVYQGPGLVGQLLRGIARTHRARVRCTT